MFTKAVLTVLSSLLFSSSVYSIEEQVEATDKSKNDYVIRLDSEQAEILGPMITLYFCKSQ